MTIATSDGSWPVKKISVMWWSCRKMAKPEKKQLSSINAVGALVTLVLVSLLTVIQNVGSLNAFRILDKNPSRRNKIQYSGYIPQIYFLANFIVCFFHFKAKIFYVCGDWTFGVSDGCCCFDYYCLIYVYLL